MDFSLFQLNFPRKSQILPRRNLKVLKCEKCSWSEPSDENTNPAVADYKFGGGSRMAVTSNCVNEKKFFQLESGEETRNIPILINFYQCIAKWSLWKWLQTVNYTRIQYGSIFVELHVHRKYIVCIEIKVLVNMNVLPNRKVLLSKFNSMKQRK